MLPERYAKNTIRPSETSPSLPRAGFHHIPVLESLFKDRRRILCSVLATLAVTGIASLTVSPRYVADAELLVLPSSIYSPQADVGGGPPPPILLERDTYLKNEVEILMSASLAEATIRKIGLARLYPDAAVPLVQHPWTRTFPVDPVVRAVSRFRRDFSATADKTGNIIVVGFHHRNPVTAADTANTAVALYLEKRGELYDDNESRVVAEHVAAQRERLDVAEKAYADFRSAYGISSYETQLDILLHQQGDIARDLARADSDTKQGLKRLDSLQAETDKVPSQVVIYSQTNQQTQIENLKTVLENLHIQEAGLRVHASDLNPVLMDVRGQIKENAAALHRLRNGSSPPEVRTGRNPVMDALELDKIHAKQDLQAAVARHDADTTQLVQVEASIGALEAREPELRRLQRQRDLAAASYQSIVRTLDDRRITESAGLMRSANVRVIQSAEVPIELPKLRTLILAAGLMLSLFAAVAAAILSEVFRRGYICAERLERDLGIPVLTSVRDLTTLASSGALLRDG